MQQTVRKVGILKEIKPLTSLRAFAAFLVFMYHYAWLFPPATRGAESFPEWIPFMAIWRQGQVGVSIFFVLSGFLITRIYFDPIAHKRASLRLFFVKRIARIWPLFLVFATVQHLVQWLRGEGINKTALVTLSMSQTFFEELRYRGLPTAWSLTIEESFYVLSPLVFMAIASILGWTRREKDPGLNFKRLAGLSLVLAGSVVLLLAAGEVIFRLVSTMGWDWEGFMRSRHHIIHATIFGRFPEFAIGILTAFIHRGVDLEKLLQRWRANAFLVLVFLGISGSLVMGSLVDQGTLSEGRILYFMRFYGTAVLAGGLVLALSVSGGRIHRFLGSSIFVYLGKISYGFYLIQLSVLITPMVHLSDKLGFFRLPALVIMVNLFCAAVYELVEAPARRLIINRFGGAE